MKTLRSYEHFYFWSKYQTGRFEIWNIGGKMVVFDVSGSRVEPFPDMEAEIELI